MNLRGFRRVAGRYEGEVDRDPFVLVLGGGALAFGILGVVAPSRLASLLGPDDAGIGRELGFRDVGNALVFASGASRAALFQRMVYDVSDAIRFGRRRPGVGAGALAFAALGAAALLRR